MLLIDEATITLQECRTLHVRMLGDAGIPGYSKHAGIGISHESLETPRSRRQAVRYWLSASGCCKKGDKLMDGAQTDQWVAWWLTQIAKEWPRRSIGRLDWIHNGITLLMVAATRSTDIGIDYISTMAVELGSGMLLPVYPIRDAPKNRYTSIVCLVANSGTAGLNSRSETSIDCIRRWVISRLYIAFKNTA